MGKYGPLSQYLRKSGQDLVRMRFEEIEKVLGFELPPSSRRHRAWWSNNPENNVMTNAWIDAGYRTEDVDLESRRLVFRRAAPERPGFAEGRSPAGLKGAPEAQSGKGAMKLYGCLRGTVRLIGDTDLTQPADPDWAHVYGGYG